jgi:rare lipoprotein A
MDDSPGQEYMSRRSAILTIGVVGLALVGCREPTSVEEGVASFYADSFHGRETASGETYSKRAMTAAHRTLPFETRVKVTNLENGRSVSVRINDRGPHVEGRVIDLSGAAARKLRMTESGTAKVRLEVYE